MDSYDYDYDYDYDLGDMFDDPVLNYLESDDFSDDYQTCSCEDWPCCGH